MSLQHITGRKRVSGYAGLTTGRDTQLRIQEAEPNLGFPTEKTLPLKSAYYQLVTYDGGDVGERYWQVAPGTAVTGISVFDEGFIVGTGNSIITLNFSGVAIAATATAFDPIAYITVAPPGNNTEILFKESGDFSTSSSFTFDNSTDTFRVGIGGTVITTLSDGKVGLNSTSPERTLDVIGDLKLTGTLYDYNDLPGSPTDILQKNVFGGIDWVALTSVKSGAGGTITNVQFHGNSGLVDGDNGFVYIKGSSSVGIGTTNPIANLEVQGSSLFSGPTFKVESMSAIATQGSIEINIEKSNIASNNRPFFIRTFSSTTLDQNYMNFDLHNGVLGGSANVMSLRADSDVGIGTNNPTKQLHLSKFGNVGGIRFGDAHLYTFGTTSLNDKGSPTFKNLNPNSNTSLSIIPSGSSNSSDLSVYATDYDLAPGAWSNFRVVANPGLPYIRVDTSSATGLAGKDISIETQVDSGGTNRPNAGQLYLKNDGNVGLSTENPQRTLDVFGTFRLSGAFTAGDGTPGGVDEVLLSTVTSTKWADLGTLTIGTAENANNVATIENTNSGDFFLTFVDFNNPSPTIVYEKVYTSANFKINPHSTVLGSSTFTFEGKSIIGNEANNANINSIADPAAALGPNAYRTLNIVDTDATIKVARLTDDTDKDAAVDLQIRSADGSTQRALWDIYGGIYGLGSRNGLAGKQRTGFFISTDGNFLIGSTQTNPELIAADVPLYGASNILQVLGDSYLDGNVGIGTSVLSDKLRVEGDAYVTGAFKDSGGNPGGTGQLLQSNITSTQWVDPSGLTAGTATALANPQNFEISGDGAAGPVSFDGTAGVNLNFTLGDTTVVANTPADPNYGSDTQIPVFSVNSQGRITSVTDTNINFAGAVAGRANEIKTSITGAGTTHYLTFVQDNNPATPDEYESVYTDSSIQFFPNIDTFKLTNSQAQASDRAALWLDNTSGAILFDDGANKRISYNDGGGDFTIRSGSYYNSGGDKYIKSPTVGDGGAANIVLSSNVVSGEIDFQTAKIGAPGNAITYTTAVRVSAAETSLLPVTPDNIDLGTSTRKWKDVYANNFVGAFVGTADNSQQLSIGRTVTNGDYYPSFVKLDNDPRKFENFYTNPGFKITESGTNIVRLETTGNIAISHAGSIALTLNDGEGDANVTFNHENGVPDRDGNAARIRCNVDSTTVIGTLEFQTSTGISASGGGVSSGTPVSLTTRALVDETGLIPGADNIYHLGSPTRRWDNVYAATFNGQFVGTADTAIKIRTTALNSFADPVYLTFVDGNNDPGLDEDLRTNGNLSYNINSNTLTFTNADISGNINVDGTTNLDNTTVDGTLNVTGNITLGNAGSDTVTFNARPNSSIIPSADISYDLGTNTVRWRNIYADNFIGNISGNATSSDTIDTRERNTGDNFLTFVDFNNPSPTAEILYTNANIKYNAGTNTLTSTNASFSGTLTVGGVSTFNGNVVLGNANTDRVTFTARPNSSIIPAADSTYNLGADTIRWGTIYADTFDGSVTGGAGSAAQVETTQKNESSDIDYITFVNTNPTAATAQNLNTSSYLYFRPSNTLGTRRLTVDANLLVANTASFNGNVVLGNSTTSPFDTITFRGRPNTSIIPNANSTYDLGTNTVRWRTVYADNFTGNISGTASGITGADIAFAGGDATSPGQTFDGSANLTYNLQLAEILPAAVAGTTFGNATTVPTVQVDRKGRVTSIGTATITFPPSSSSIAYSAFRAITTNGAVISSNTNNELITFAANDAGFILPTITATIPTGFKVTIKVLSGSGSSVRRGTAGNLINGLNENLILDVSPSSFDIVLTNIGGTRQWITI